MNYFKFPHKWVRNSITRVTFKVTKTKPQSQEAVPTCSQWVSTLLRLRPEGHLLLSQRADTQVVEDGPGRGGLAIGGGVGGGTLEKCDHRSVGRHYLNGSLVARF